MGELESLIVHSIVIGGWSILGALLGYRAIRKRRFKVIIRNFRQVDWRKKRKEENEKISNKEKVIRV